MHISFTKRISQIPIIIACLWVSACTVTLVQPYDADLYKSTEDFYISASKIIAKGISVSPASPGELEQIAEPEEHSGHYNQFKQHYDELLIDSNALILRSLANSGKIDEIGRELQKKIELAIQQNLPSDCDALQQEFSDVSLTTRNYIDLKCIVGRWDSAHKGNSAVGDVTRGKKILPQSIWQGRTKSLFDGILAIQEAEAFKKSDE